MIDFVRIELNVCILAALILECSDAVTTTTTRTTTRTSTGPTFVDVLSSCPSTCTVTTTQGAVHRRRRTSSQSGCNYDMTYYADSAYNKTSRQVVDKTDCVCTSNEWYQQGTCRKIEECVEDQHTCDELARMAAIAAGVIVALCLAPYCCCCSVCACVGFFVMKSQEKKNQQYESAPPASDPGSPYAVGQPQPQQLYGQPQQMYGQPQQMYAQPVQGQMYGQPMQGTYAQPVQAQVVGYNPGTPVVGYNPGGQVAQAQVVQVQGTNYVKERE